MALLGGEPAASRNLLSSMSSQPGHPKAMSRKSSDLGSETFSLGINPTCFFCSSAGQMVVLTIGQMVVMMVVMMVGQRADYLVE